MKHWTLPSQYRCIADAFILPAVFDRRKEYVKFLDNNPTIQLLIDILEVAPDIDVGKLYEGSDLWKGADERLEKATIWNGKQAVKAAISYIVMEQFLGHDFGNDISPSRYFGLHPVSKDKATKESAIAFCKEAWDVNGTFRSAIITWSVYVHCNGLRPTLDKYWFFREKERWMHNDDRKQDVQLHWS